MSFFNFALGAKELSLLIFIVAYLLFVFWPGRRTLVAVVGAVLLLILQVMSPDQIFWAINWNVMGMFIGMLAVADVFMESRVPAYFAEVIVNRAKNTAWSILLICLMTGFISAFVENVATVLIVAPIALALAKKLKINPTDMMIAIAISSNLQGTATLIGDPPSMLLGGFAKMNFMDFFFYQGRPSIFWAVELGAIFSFFVLMYLFRRFKQKECLVPEEKIRSLVPAMLLIVLVFLLATSTLYDQGFPYTAGLLCMIFGFLSLVFAKLSDRVSVRQNILKLDWDSSLFLIGVFVLVGGLTANGWVATVANSFSQLIGGNVFLGYTLIVVVSVIISAFVDNVPYLVAMLPVAATMAQGLQISPNLFLFGLLIGASLGGNITPIGASANIVACSILKKEGYPVSFGRFVKIGLPFTLVAVLAGYLFIWLTWH